MTKYKTIKSRLLNDYVACGVDCNGNIKIKCVPINGGKTIILPLHKIVSTDEEVIDSLISFLEDGDIEINEPSNKPEEIVQPAMSGRTLSEICNNDPDENDSDEPIGRPAMPHMAYREAYDGVFMENDADEPREACSDVHEGNNIEEFLHQVFGAVNPVNEWYPNPSEDSE